jgi:hypothetical protein
MVADLGVLKTYVFTNISRSTLLLCSHNRKAALHGTVGSRETASILQGCGVMGYKKHDGVPLQCGLLHHKVTPYGVPYTPESGFI